MSTTTSGGTTTSFNNTPQAVDDSFSVSEDLGVTYFDVMANDLGGKAKVLWSIDDSTTDGSTGEAGTGDGTTDLLSRDVAGVCEMSDLGARMWMTADGKIGYDTSIFNYLAAGETAVDTFTYAIRLSNGTLSWATVTVTITGTNDAPVAVADSASVDEDSSISGNVGGNDTDADTGAVLTYALVGAAPTGLTFGTDGSWSFDASSYDSLADGEELELVIPYTVTDEHGASDGASLTITITGTNDAPVASAIVLAAIAEDSGGRLITQAELLAGSSDVDEDTLTVTALSIASGSGSLVDNGDGTWTYNPALDDDTSVTFNYTVSDGSLSDSSTATLDITPVDDFVYVPPTPFAGTGDPNDFDDAGPAAGATITTSTVSGTETWNGTNGSDTVNAGNGTDAIYGHNGNDVLNGQNGADISVYGQRGDDTLTGGSGADRIYGGSGNDTIYGNEPPVSNESGDTGDTLYGGSGNDVIYGQGGNDVIVGGYGADTLSGGSGADIFAYLSALDTGDTITDFSQTDGDKIDLTAFAPSSFVGALTQAGAVGANQVGYMQVGGTTVIYVDTNGIYGADLEITLDDTVSLVAGDFLFGP